MTEVRMRNEQIQQEGACMFTMVRRRRWSHLLHEGTYTYLDIRSRTSRRSSGDAGFDKDSDDAPDPDEPLQHRLLHQRKKKTA